METKYLNFNITVDPVINELTLKFPDADLVINARYRGSIELPSLEVTNLHALLAAMINEQLIELVFQITEPKSYQAHVNLMSPLLGTKIKKYPIGEPNFEAATYAVDNIKSFLDRFYGLRDALSHIEPTNLKDEVLKEIDRFESHCRLLDSIDERVICRDPAPGIIESFLGSKRYNKVKRSLRKLLTELSDKLK